MNKNVKLLVLTALFAAVQCVLSLVSVPLPFSPVPFTLGLLAVFLTGSFLPPVNAFIAEIVYLLIGIVGIPVFAGFKSGVAVLAGPTGGFLIAYPFMALITALFIRFFSKKSKFLLPLAGMIISIAVCYVLGTAVFCIYAKTSVAEALPKVVLPFIPFDCVKAVIASALRLALNKRISAPTEK